MICARCKLALPTVSGGALCPDCETRFREQPLDDEPTDKPILESDGSRSRVTKETTMSIVKVKLPDGSIRLLSGNSAAWLPPDTVPDPARKLKTWKLARPLARLTFVLGYRRPLRQIKLADSAPLDIVLIPFGDDKRLMSVEVQPPPKDPLWQVVEVLPTDYAGYGGEVSEEDKDGDCSAGCRWAAYLENSGDWLVCTKPGAPRLGLLTWEHQAGHGCFEWGCESCLQSADDCKCQPEKHLEQVPSRCSFCGKGRRDVAHLVASKRDVSICNECIGLCYNLIGGETGPTHSHTLRPEQYAALVAWANELEDDAVSRWKADKPLPDDVAAITPGFDAVLAVAQELRDRLKPKAPPITWGWAVDHDPDCWEIGPNGEGYPTRAAAITAARDHHPDGEVWVTTGAQLLPSAVAPDFDQFDPPDWMDSNLRDNYGDDYAESWCRDLFGLEAISPAARLVFDELIGAWADRWLKPLPWRASSKKPERINEWLDKNGNRWSIDDMPEVSSDSVPYNDPACICTETVVGKSECPVHGPPPALYPCRPVPCTLCNGGALDRCDMCGCTGQTCATHARSWSLCADERDKP
jgi:hypothetical protein